MQTCRVSNWGWIASVATETYRSAGEFLLALAFAHVAVDADAVQDIMRVFATYRAAHTSTIVFRSAN